VELSVQPRGYEPQTQTAVATAGMGPVEFRLKPAKIARGRLLDPSGKPVAGVGVFTSGFGKHKGVMLRTWTDFEGRFRWDDAPAGAIGLMLSKEGYYTPMPVAFVAGKGEQEVVLKPALVVEFSACDARTGEPIKNFSVTVGRTNPVSGKFSWDPAIDSNVSDGDYRGNLDAAFAPYRFRLEARGFELFVSRGFPGDEKEVRQVLDLVRKAEIPRD